MFRAIDGWLIDKYETAGLKLQRKGYLLTTARVHSTGVVLATTVCSSVMSKSWGLMAFTSVLWLVCLYGDYRFARRNDDYPTSAKKIQALNSLVVLTRESSLLFNLRIGTVVLIAIFVWVDLTYFWTGPWVRGLIEVAMDVALVSYSYIRCCSFIGPGEFAKEKQEKLSGNTQLSRG